MALRLPHHWVWDFWFAQDGDDVHLFFLHAPRSIGDPDLRHGHARIGHAVSRDLRSWELLPPALVPGPEGSWDDRATWTGSVIRAGARWHMFYTGVSAAENGMVQRIGRAVSDDLVRWERVGVAVEAAPEWYEKGEPRVREEAWRDPWVFADEDGGGFHMLVTARAREGPEDGRGVIGYASSPDLDLWSVGPPRSAPGEFRTLEVPQLVHLGGSWRVLFSVHTHEHSAQRLARPGVEPEGGTHFLVGDTQLGPYRLDGDSFLLGTLDMRFYAARAIEHRGAWYLIAWHHTGADRRFLGELTDPMPLLVADDGSLSVDVPPSVA
jgi:beta-fructofuranosidase